ncbi:peptidase M61 [Curvibacter sp. APW13]|uniref:M61 family metallopeptidase n=1 Tax=Curvibacter sp. APW13 TaxID=3077236 RepID=UPI0028DE9D27|nr:peptidase M61 [Curvibacter sp. APW13]MDT8989722.1 peptidase M61 [Curvibacter sp. APW13]
MSTKKHTGTAPVQYQVECADLHAHLYAVTMTVEAPNAMQTLRLPVWIPGSYMVREFSKHVQELQARQGGKPVALQQLDKCSWQVACQPGAPLTLQYRVYAFDNSVRTAWLDSARGFFNGTSLLLRAEGLEDQPHTLDVVAPDTAPRWKLATGLAPHKVDRQGFGRYTAPDYHALIDCPVEMGDFWSGSFTAHGVPHRFVVAGAAPGFDGERLLADTQKICEAQIDFWHGKRSENGSASRSKEAGYRPIPFQGYTFLLNAVGDGYGGLEHRNSTALICQRADLPRKASVLDAKTASATKSEGYTTLLGLISHEYFHSWNVKQLRPAEFARFDYQQENYTELLWFFEGFTSYYDDLFLRRAGLIDDATYLKLLTKTLQQVAQTPGQQVQSVAQASFDAWVKYYRQDENTPNATISYYTKGSLVALCLDLTLRTEGHTTLDDVMRALWERTAGGPLAEADVAAVLQQLGGRSFAKELRQWVHGTKALPCTTLLAGFGVEDKPEAVALDQRLGLRTKPAAGVMVRQVLRGGAAEAAGFCAGDEWLAVAPKSRPDDLWRLSALADLPLYASERDLIALVHRDRRVLKLPLRLPPDATQPRLTLKDSAALHRWLEDAAHAPATPPARRARKKT